MNCCRFFCVFLSLLTVLLAPLSGQSEVKIRISEGMPLVPIAIPEFTLTSPSSQDAALRAELYETLWNDLEFSRVFRIIPQGQYSYIPRTPGGRIPFRDWAALQANLLVTGQVEVTGDRILFNFQVYETGSERQIMSRNFGGKRDLVRLLAHRAADELMKSFGERPLFASKIVFVSDRKGEKEIYLIDYDGRRETRLTVNQAMELLPSWSANGEKIVFTSYRRNSPELYIYDLYSGATQLLSTGGVNYAADWSMDGERIVYTSSKDGNADIYVYHVPSGQHKRLTFHRGIDTSPVWNPSGREIAFISDRSGSPQVYLMDAEGANVRRITYEGSYYDSPAWSPDGTRIAFVARIESRFDIYVYHLQSGAFAKITENAGRNENPCWSPDGRHLVFSSNRGGSAQLYLVDFDGSNVRQLTTTGQNRMPKWQKSVR